MKIKKHVLKVWVEQVRNLSYDIEDCLENFMVHVGTDGASLGWGGACPPELRNFSNELLISSTNMQRNASNSFIKWHYFLWWV
jgi:hypothetical protein